MQGDRVATIGVLVLAGVVVAFLGADALLYPNGGNVGVVIGALVSIASAAGGYFFHAQQQGFFGTSLAAQRDAYLNALRATDGGPGLTTTSAPSGSATSANLTTKTDG